MKAWSIAGILAVAVGLLFSTTGHAWYVSTEWTDWDKYETEGGEGDHHADSDYGGESTYFSYADVWAEIEGEEQNTAAGAYAYVYWTETVLGYNPELGPPLVAHVTSDAYAKAYAEYELDDSDYAADAAATGYASGYSVLPQTELDIPRLCVSEYGW